MMVRSSPDTASDFFSGSKEFADEIDNLACLVKDANSSSIKKAKAFAARKKAKLTWCAPTCDIDDYLFHIEGYEQLANEIYELL